MINRMSLEPIYLQISEYLKKNIQNNTFKKGTKIPTELELMEKFAVSRTTVRLALKKLIEENLIEARSGKGTFVKSNIKIQDYEGFKGLFETMVEQGTEPDTLLLDYIKKHPYATVAKSLNISETELILNISRLYKVDQTPIGVAQISVPPDFIELISKEDAGHYPTHRIMSDRGGYSVKNADVSIFSKRVSECSEMIAHSLELKNNDVVLGLERVLYSGEGNPVEHAFLWFKADAYKFSMHLSKGTNIQLLKI